MRAPKFALLVPAVVVSAVLVLATPALAGWSSTPVTVHPTSATISSVAADGDGSGGAFVLWQEEDAPGSGVLRAQHLLSTGDPDPAWPADGALLCGVSASRTDLVAVADGTGGLYGAWLEGSALYVKRTGAGGSAATGWPDAGRVVSTTLGAAHVDVIADGLGGIYAAYATGLLLDNGVMLAHLGPDGGAGAGWTGTTHGLVNTFDVASREFMGARVALADGGGVWVSWSMVSLDDTLLASGHFLQRLTPTGGIAHGWPAGGLAIETFDGVPLWQHAPPQAAMTDVAADGSGGAYLASLTPIPPYEWTAAVARLRRVGADGSPAAPWPAEGRLLSEGSGYFNSGTSGDLVQVESDRHGGAWVTWPELYDHGIAMPALRVDGSNVLVNPAAGGGERGGLAPSADGSLYVGEVQPCGPYGPYSPWASVGVTYDPPAGYPAWAFFEYTTTPVQCFYGDQAVASLPDDGAIFFWSRVQSPTGLFARRFNAGLEVTGVAPPRPAASLTIAAARFAPGAGLRARVDLPGDGAARLEAFDVLGRRVAQAALYGAGTREVTLGRSADLPAGLYLLRVSQADAHATARVLVVR